MSSYLLWFELGIKISLFLGTACSLWMFVYRKGISFTPFPSFTFLMFPFFLVFKITEAMGIGGANHICYISVAILLNSLWIIHLYPKPAKNLQDIRELISKKIKNHSVLVVSLVFLFVFFCVRGLYLEYPGDAIVYLQRVGQANQDSAANLSSLWSYDSDNNFFSSLQQWFTNSDSLLRSKLTFVAAISSCALGFSSYKLAYWATQDKQMSLIATFLSLAFYGNLQISFYLYKILQGATLAMICYLEMLPLLHILFIQPLRESSNLLPKRYLIPGLLIILWMMQDCHQEKVLYVFAVLLSVSALTLCKSWFTQDKLPEIALLSGLGAIALSGVLFLSNREPIDTLPNYLVTEWFSIGSVRIMTYWPSPPNSSYILLDFICLGLIAIVLVSSNVKSKYFFMAAVALSPYLLFLNPITVTGLLKLTHSANLYRILIAGLPWIFLPLACNFLQKFHDIKIKNLPILLLCFGLIAYPPVYGKLPHAFHRVPSYANGRDLAPIVNYLLRYSAQQPREKVKVLADPYINSYLSAWPNFQVASDRWLRSEPESYDKTLSDLFSSEITEDAIEQRITDENYQIIIINRKEVSGYTSWLGKVTTHWPPELLQSHRALFSGTHLQSYLAHHPDRYLLLFEKNNFMVYSFNPSAESSDSNASNLSSNR